MEIIKYPEETQIIEYSRETQIIEYYKNKNKNILEQTLNAFERNRLTQINNLFCNNNMAQTYNIIRISSGMAGLSTGFGGSFGFFIA